MLAFANSVYTTMYSSSVATALLTLHPIPSSALPSTWEFNFNWLLDRGGLRLELYSKRPGQGCLRGVHGFKLFSISHLYGGFVFIPSHWFVAGVQDLGANGSKLDETQESEKAREWVFFLLLHGFQEQHFKSKLKIGKSSYVKKKQTYNYCRLAALDVITCIISVFQYVSGPFTARSKKI